MNRQTQKRRLERAGPETDSRIDWLMSRSYPLTKPERTELKRLLERARLERAGFTQTGEVTMNATAYEAGRRWALMTNGDSLCDEPEYVAACRYRTNEGRADFVRGARENMRPHRRLHEDCAE